MNISEDGVVLERFDPTTFEAGIPQNELPCGDPACLAAPGVACGEFCTVARPDPEPRHEDLVPVGAGRYAVRHCPRCSGDGTDISAPDQGLCCCCVSSQREQELREEAQIENAQAKDEQQVAAL